MQQATILRVRNITKTYPGVCALDNITLDFRKGEVHAIAGENGAGKSTLIKILTGAIHADRGDIEFEGIVHHSFTLHEAQFELGIAAIYQEFNLIPELSVAENIFFGKELQNGLFLDAKQMQLATEKILNQLDVAINPRALVKNLSVAYRQIVEIAKAVSQNVKILIMDEPSAPLSTNEVEHMFQLVKTLQAQGVTIIYISHRLPEVFELSDRVSVLRDGKLITTLDTKRTDRKELITLMVGRELGETYPQRTFTSADVLLEVKHLSTPQLLKDISFTLHKGEILGFGGLVGAGRTELARAIFGADAIESGEIFMEGQKVVNRTPSQAVKHRIGLIPEDRKQLGILADMSIKQNISFSSLPALTSSFGLISSKAEHELARSFKAKLRIATPDLDREVKYLSGGNQQKVVLAKWLATDCQVILFDEPTRGIDVGAKQEIYELIVQLAAEGKGIILISSEMSELLGMSDRILVMREGELVGALSKGEATQHAILDLASAK
jgi:ribose transport system ATP-binding protein